MYLSFIYIWWQNIEWNIQQIVNIHHILVISMAKMTTSKRSWFLFVWSSNQWIAGNVSKWPQTIDDFLSYFILWYSYFSNINRKHQKRIQELYWSRKREEIGQFFYFNILTSLPFLWETNQQCVIWSTSWQNILKIEQ